MDTKISIDERKRELADLRELQAELARKFPTDLSRLVTVNKLIETKQRAIDALTGKAGD